MARKRMAVGGPGGFNQYENYVKEPVPQPSTQAVDNSGPTVMTNRRFNDAFKEARVAGLDTFMWNGREYTTQLRNEARSSRRSSSGSSGGTRRSSGSSRSSSSSRRSSSSSRRGTRTVPRNSGSRSQASASSSSSGSSSSRTSDPTLGQQATNNYNTLYHYNNPNALANMRADGAAQWNNIVQQNKAVEIANPPRHTRNNNRNRSRARMRR